MTTLILIILVLLIALSFLADYKPRIPKSRRAVKYTARNINTEILKNKYKE